ncbi:cupin domain-containing protein [Nostoc sp. C052]|uniref:cupin domain-containing protein n=1 Tax=Nostoc sp. C052 TaxID=2576902 RepID=UPI0015C3212F|nr:cupin domain-containing protein [Nostoc sp. C052]QLE43515.1 cupin domain-containing protein [Nostoc sp. C052]
MEEIFILRSAETNEDNPGFFFKQLSKTPGIKSQISMFIATIQPGEHVPPHFHPDGSEAMIYNLSGSVEVKYGQDLKKSVIVNTGDFIYIPGNVLHQVINLSATEPVKSIIACNFDVIQEIDYCL